MIYIYNENESKQWEITGSEGGTRRVQLINNPDFGINILDDSLEESAFNTQALESTNDQFKPNVLLDIDTSVRYDGKNLRPSVRLSKVNSDVYIVSYDISSGQRVINLSINKAYIHASLYDYKNHQLHVIFSMNTEFSKPFLEFLFMNKDKTEVSLRHFMIINGNPRMVSKYMKLDGKLKKGDRGYIDPKDNSVGEDGTDFMIRTYLPLKPTTLIIVEDNEYIEKINEFFTNNFHLSSKGKGFIYANIHDADDLRSFIKSYAYGHYRCATYYVPTHNHHDGKEVAEVKTHILEELHGKLFEHVLVMWNDGWITRLK